MPRSYEIRAAFVEAIQQNQKGYICIRTSDFIASLRKKNWHFTQDYANAWIKQYQPDFADKTTDGSENRYWILRNMGRVF
ncbi:hypothetical protein [Enterobacter soli]|uniref:hypothetical protein n=1 Tax=Enterobacter soli TaxID=885040 RepID=UPI002F420845